MIRAKVVNIVATIFEYAVKARVDGHRSVKSARLRMVGSNPTHCTKLTVSLTLCGTQNIALAGSIPD